MATENASAKKNDPPQKHDKGVQDHEPAPSKPADALLRSSKLDPNSMSPEMVFQLQRTVGNQATIRLLRDKAQAKPPPPQPNAPPAPSIQRRNGAAPLNFAATNDGVIQDNNTCIIKHGLTWASTTGNLDDLDDHTTREVVTFNHNPITDMPSYGGPLPFGMVVAGNVMTKTVSTMDRPGGADQHDGAGNGTGFSVGGQPNLTKAAWTLIGTQDYEVSDDGGVTWNNLLGPFTITRTMILNGAQYELTITKTGPGINLSAGPTPIYDVLTSEAIAAVGGAAPDQTAGWNFARGAIFALGLGIVNIKTVNKVANGAPLTVTYNRTHPNNPAGVGMAQYILPTKTRKLIVSKAEDAINNIIPKVPNMPARMIVTLMYDGSFGNGLPAQQSLETNENGGTYRVLLRAEKLMNVPGHMVGSVPGEYSQGAWTNKGKRERYTKGSMTHETGHLLHAFTSPDKFRIATMSQMNYVANPLDPLDAEKAQLSRINTDIMMALNARPYSNRWNYAKNPMQANPAEVVAEVFTALMNKRKDVPQGLAAVYLAYGGMRSPQIDALLTRIFGGPVPTFAEVQHTIPVIQND